MPSPAVIVGGVVITAGAIYVFKEYGWPHVEPTAREIVEEIKSLWERASGHRRRAAPHHSHTSRSSSPFDDSEETKRHSFHSSSTSSDDESGSSTAFRRSSRMHESVEMTHLVKDETNGWADQGSHIRRRKAPSNELGVAGLPLYDEPNPFSSFKPMTPTTVNSQQNRNASPPADIDPFRINDEDDMKTPAKIPLPLSPDSSAVLPADNAVVGQGSTDKNHMTLDRSQQYQPMAASPLISNLTPTSPPQLLPTIPQPVPLSSDHLIAHEQQQQHPLTRSTTSSTSSNQFQPVHASSSGVRSPENARATSPSGLSDNMSMVSATPSRTWTDGGTAEIFSGSEKDFRGNDSDRDDIESVSDSGSWEDVGAGVASPRAGGAGRLSR
ncbi:hypothetical protein FRC03_007642 [Tulasnella sp. 419]|nr:hypothetical protein FRC03_007642 [Tulasnella sp. 419]